MRNLLTCVLVIATCLSSCKEQSKGELRVGKSSTSKKENLDSIWLDSIHKISIRAYKAKDFTDFKRLGEVYLNRALDLKDTLHLAKGNYKLGSYHFRKFIYDSAFYHFDQAKNFYINRGDSLQAGANLLNMAIIQSNVSDFYGSERTSIEALEYLEPLKNKKYLTGIYNNLGIISNELIQYDESRKWYYKSLGLTTKTKQCLVLLNNLGIVHRDEKNYNDAISSFKNVIEHPAINKYPLVKAMSLDNLGYVYFLKNEKNPFPSLEEAYSLRIKENSINGVIVSELHIGEYYFSKDKKQLAKNKLLNALKLAKKIGDTKNTLKALELLSNFDNERSYSLRYNSLRDSVIERERYLKHQFARIKFQTEKKEKQNLFLASQNNLQTLKLDQQERQTYVWITIVISSVLIMIIGFLFARQRQKILKQKIAMSALKARADEKDHLAIYLHEDISSDILGGLQLGDRLQKEASNENWEKVLLLFDNAYQKIRRVSQEMSVQHFSTTPFERKVTLLTNQVSFNANLTIDISGLRDLNWDIIPEEVKVALYGILQEALNNIQKHAIASNVTISFSFKRAVLLFDVWDDGIGYTKLEPVGIGLLHIEKRVRDMQGLFVLNKTSKPRGTKLNITIPKYW